VDTSAWPSDPDEARKLNQSFRATLKEELASGKTKMWGVGLEGLHGFSIFEENAKSILARSRQVFPYIKGKIMPMLSFEESEDVMKDLQG
jgi:hypothetical protein